MKATVWHGIGDIRVEEVTDPKILEPSDAIVRVTGSAIRGKDLHLARGTMPGTQPDASPSGEQWVPGNAPSPAVRRAVEAVAKAGTIGVIGFYPPGFSSFPFGQAMNENLTVHMGNCDHRRNVPELLGLVATGAFDPTAFITQREDPIAAIEAYEAFDRREEGWLKTVLEVAA